MIDLQTYSLFLLTALVLVLSPGPDTVLILSRTIASGVKPGLMTLLGTQTGNVIHAMLAGVGVSGIVLMFAGAFDFLKTIGATYLVYLAVVTWRAPCSLELDAHLASKPGGARTYFYQGLTNNLVNPKVIVFFIALFPQFVHPENGPVALQGIILGITLAAMAIVWMGILVLILGRVRLAVASNTTFLKLANRFAAIAFFGLACRIAVQER